MQKISLPSSLVADCAAVLQRIGHHKLAGDLYENLMRECHNREPTATETNGNHEWLMMDVTEYLDRLGVHLGSDRCKQLVELCDGYCARNRLPVGDRTHNGRTFKTFPQVVIAECYEILMTSGKKQRDVAATHLNY